MPPEPHSLTDVSWLHCNIPASMCKAQSKYLLLHTTTVKAVSHSKYKYNKKKIQNSITAGLLKRILITLRTSSICTCLSTPPKVFEAPVYPVKLMQVALMCPNEGKYTISPVCGCPQQHKLPVFWPLQPWECRGAATHVLFPRRREEEISAADHRRLNPPPPRPHHIAPSRPILRDTCLNNTCARAEGYYRSWTEQSLTRTLNTSAVR